uniref:SH3 domain-containing protein n=1 Tax=Zonotrichia albicollis TaxID=44394 RepID=A0A8D2M6H2_ZONAL
MLIIWKHPKLNIVIKLLLFPQNYMMFVSWSDQNNILIYRTFEDFRKFHVSEFPIPEISRFVEKMLLQGPRSIAVLSQLCPCYFEGITMQQRKGGKLNRCLEILKLLESYSQELLKTDVKISRGEEVNQFFKAQTQDLDPSFPENSAVIMPSVFRREKGPQPLSITLPQASQSYRCIKAFETKDTKNKLFTVAQEEIVEVLIKDMTGWWLVENADKQIAWFPATYLEEIFSTRQTQPFPLSAGSLYFVVQAYEAQKADELSLNQGVVVEVLRTSHNGWWLIRRVSMTAWASWQFLELVFHVTRKASTASVGGRNPGQAGTQHSPPRKHPWALTKVPPGTFPIPASAQGQSCSTQGVPAHGRG